MTSMVLTWTAPSGETPTGYIVYRDDGDSTAMPTPSIVAFEGDALTTTVDGLTGGTTYTYMIAALSGSNFDIFQSGLVGHYVHIMRFLSGVHVSSMFKFFNFD